MQDVLRLRHDALRLAVVLPRDENECAGDHVAREELHPPADDERVAGRLLLRERVRAVPGRVLLHREERDGEEDLGRRRGVEEAPVDLEHGHLDHTPDHAVHEVLPVAEGERIERHARDKLVGGIEHAQVCRRRRRRRRARCGPSAQGRGSCPATSISLRLP